MNKIQSSECSQRIRKEAAQLQQKKFRKLRNMFIIEGILPLEEAAKSSYRILQIFYHPGLLEKKDVLELISGIQKRDGTSCYEVNERVLRELSSEVSPQGIVAVAEQRIFEPGDFKGNLLLLDAIQDPGNAGTLFRIAHWFALGGLLLTEDSVEAFNPKLIRGSMGSIFHLPFLEFTVIPDVLLQERTLILSKVHEGSDIRKLPLEGIQPFILVIGNEARGVREEWETYPHMKLTLPAPGAAESLNAAVAAALILSKLIY